MKDQIKKELTEEEWEELKDFSERFQHWRDNYPDMDHSSDEFKEKYLDQIPEVSFKLLDKFVSIYERFEEKAANVTLREYVDYGDKGDSYLVPTYYMPAIQQILVELLNIRSVENLEKEVETIKALVLKPNDPLLAVTHQDYWGAFLTTKNEHAYILDQKQLKFTFDETGKPIIGTEEEYKDFQQIQNGEIKEAPANYIDQNFLEAVAYAVLKAFPTIEGYIIKVDVPSFARYLDMEFRKKAFNKQAESHGKKNINNNKETKRADLWGKLNQLEGKTGFLDGDLLAVYKFNAYRTKENILEFSSPYIVELIKKIKVNPTKTIQKQGQEFSIKGFSFHIRGKADAARSKPTIQALHTLISGIERRGNDPDIELNRKRKISIKDKETISYKISYSSLINKTPLLKLAIDTAGDTHKMEPLKRVIALLPGYISEYTDLESYYIDFKVKLPIPTSKTLDSDVVIISHKGKNPNYIPAEA